MSWVLAEVTPWGQYEGSEPIEGPQMQTYTHAHNMLKTDKQKWLIIQKVVKSSNIYIL